ncbi:MAG: hypothetical protein J1F35_03595 [Erysipelotrichales bacterium]|nr:hypothetical protein [Erysipelotrichales bacterium]
MDKTNSTENSFIKHLKPRKNGKYHQGVIDPKACKKYYSSCLDEPIIYRSGLEYKFINYCESVPSIIKWASEPIKIPYYSRLDKKQVNYYPDYVIENENGTKCIVEVKPYDQTIRPKPNDSKWLKAAWIKNTDKWNAAYKFAHEHGMKFIIVTEKFFT